MPGEIFISHASEDKNTVAIPLADTLERAGLSVWIDYRELRIGDDLHGRINEGLASCRMGVVLLSHAFLAKNWPLAELSALALNDRLFVVVVDISRDELARKQPLLAGKVYASWADGVDRLVADISRRLGNTWGSKIAIEWSHSQDNWNGLSTALDRIEPRPTRITRGVLQEPTLLADAAVLVVPLPHHSHLAEEEMSRIEAWVKDGGGVLLLGYYGERHHESNLGQLAWRFDLTLEDNLVMPAGASQTDTRAQVMGSGARLRLTIPVGPAAHQHAVLSGVETIVVQSSASLLSETLSRPELIVESPPDSLVMRPLGQIQPKGGRPNIEAWEVARTAAAAILLARSWEAGRVAAVGTWKLLTLQAGDNARLLGNLLTWLGGERLEGTQVTVSYPRRQAVDRTV